MNPAPVSGGERVKRRLVSGGGEITVRLLSP